MPALDRNSPMKFTKCNQFAVKKNMAIHKQSCNNGTLSCTKCPNFYTKKKEDLSYYLAKHHARKNLSLVQCVLFAWKNAQAFILFENTEGERMEIEQNLGQNRVKNSKKF